MAELPLFDHAAAAQAREEAIARVTYHADPAWLATALKAVHRLAVDRLSFTTDDIWARAEAAEDLPHEPRALGNVMRRAAREQSDAKVEDDHIEVLTSIRFDASELSKDDIKQLVDLLHRGVLKVSLEPAQADWVRDRRRAKNGSEATQA